MIYLKNDDDVDVDVNGGRYRKECFVHLIIIGFITF